MTMGPARFITFTELQNGDCRHAQISVIRHPADDSGRSKPIDRILCRPGQRTDVMGAVHPRPGLAIRKLTFTLGPEAMQGQIWFLGLSLLPLGDWLNS